MIIRFLLLPAILFIALKGIMAQNGEVRFPETLNPMQGLSAEITVADLRKEIGFLASDSLKGRKPGLPENKVAAEYIRDVMKNAGLKMLFNDGMQELDLVVDIHPGARNEFSIDGFQGRIHQDFIPLTFSSNASAEAGAVFAGYGFDLDLDSLKWNDYAGIDVKGKWAVILRGDPESDKPNSLFVSYAQERAKALTAKDKGAIGVIFVTPTDMEKADILPQLHYDKTPSGAGIPVISVTRAMADRILASMNYTILDLESSIKDNHAPNSLILPVRITVVTDLVQEKVTSYNVVGMVQGTDPVLKNEYIVIGAHYDHLGWGGDNSGSRTPQERAIHNGADDNASGTAGVLELAHKLSDSDHLLKRSIILVAFTAEEMGLLGSKAFINNPPFDLSKFKAMMNMDMIGRLNTESKTISVGGTGTSTESDTIVKTLSVSRPFKVTRSPDGYGPSDHAVFYSENIPVFYFTTGAHEDYHMPGDDSEKINYQGEADILSMVFDLAVLLSDRNESLVFRESGSKQGVRYGRGFKVTMGIVPDMVSSDGTGLRVDGVRKGGPADQAGIIKGDVITSLDGQPVTNIHDYTSRLGKLKQGQVAAVELLRDGEKKVLIVQF